MSIKRKDSIEEKTSEENKYSLYKFDFDFYPPVKDFNDLGGKYDIYKKNDNSPTFLNNGIKEEIKEDKEKDTYEINEDFFGALLGKNNYDLNKEKKINTISKLIRKSKLMEKLEKESDSNKNNDLGTLSTMCAKNLSFMELKKGKVLFKVGDKGDRFYFILSGKVTILKPREIHTKMNLSEYLYYLTILIKEKEDFLFNEVILKNCTQIPITTVEEVKGMYKIFFLINLKVNLENGTIYNNKQLKLFFDKNFQSFHDYNLEKSHLEILEQKKIKLEGNKQWSNYILQNCYLTKAEIRSLGRFRTYNEKRNIICYAYDSFLYLGPGFFFGDAALEEKVSKRNATIRAEEDTVLGFLKSVDYSNMIAPQRKLEKMKEINFLINNFFFKNINIKIFEKNLFHLFTLNENNRGTILFNYGSMPKYLLFLKEGNLSLTLECSVLEINNIIEKICNKLIDKYNSELIKKNIIPKEKINILKGYLEDNQILSNLKEYTKEFIQEINKKRTFQIAVFDSVECVGLEEIFLGIPYITQAIVTSEKIIFYKYAIEKIQSNLLETHHINYFYIKSAINKIFSLIERLKNLKQNYIDIAKMRHENPNSFRSKKLPILKNANDNIFYLNSIEIYSTLAKNSPITKRVIKISRNIRTEIKQKKKDYQVLSYSENKENAKIKTDDNSKDNEIYNSILKYKSPISKKTYMKNNLLLSVLLDPKNGNRIYNEKSQNLGSSKNININKNLYSNININYSKFSDSINFIKKEKKNKIFNFKEISEKNLKEEEKSKFPIIKRGHKKKLLSALNSKSHDSIKLNRKLLSLDRLKRKIRKSEFNIYDNTKQIIQNIRPNIYYLDNEKHYLNKLHLKELNSISFIKTENDSIEKDILGIEIKRQKSSINRKSQKIKKYHFNFIPLLIENTDNNKYQRNLNINTNDIKSKDNNIISTNNKLNTSRDNNKISKNNLKFMKNSSFKFKNKKLLLEKLFLNKRNKSKKNLNNKIYLLKKDYCQDKSKNNNFDISPNYNSDNEKQILPIISKKNLDLNNSKELKREKNNLIINPKELIPEIIRNYYEDKKLKGYASLIPHKNSNTLFLRKFHKKYNQNEKNIEQK